MGLIKACIGYKLFCAPLRRRHRRRRLYGRRRRVRPMGPPTRAYY